MPPQTPQTLEDLCELIEVVSKADPSLFESSALDPRLLQHCAEQLTARAAAEEAKVSAALKRKRQSAAFHQGAETVSWSLLLSSGCLVVAGLWAWRPALYYNFEGGFFMDDAMIMKNRNVYEELDLHRIFRTDYWGLEMFEEGTWTHKSFRPLTVLTFRWNYWLHTFQSSGFHMTNVVLHLASSILLGLFGKCTMGLTVDWSLLLSALFWVHPVHTESVLYIVGRADLLCLMLILIAALVYTPCIIERVRGLSAGMHLCVSSMLIVAAGLCKETGFCFFGLLAGCEILRGLAFPGSIRNQWQRCCRFAALVALGGAACAVRVWYTGGTAIENMDHHSNPIAVHADKMVRLRSYALLHGIYGKLLVWPKFLSYDYSFNAIPLVYTSEDVRLLLPLTVYLGFTLLLLGALGTLRPGRVCSMGRAAAEGPIIGVAIVILSFVPMSNILFPVGTMIGERLLYIPSAGLLVVLVGLARLSALRRLLSFLLLVAGYLGTWKCALRVPEWENSDTITVADGLTQLGSSRVQFNLANVYLQDKRYDEALLTYNRAIEIDPTDRDALPLYHAGQILFFKGQHQEAATYLQKAVSGYFSPLTIKEEEIWHDYALSLYFVHKPQEAILNFQKTLAINPTFTKAMNNLACAAGIGAMTGTLPREYYQVAINALDQAVRLDPANVLYYRNAVALMSAFGDEQRAAATWQQLTLMDPNGVANPPNDCSWEFYFR